MLTWSTPSFERYLEAIRKRRAYLMDASGLSSIGLDRTLDWLHNWLHKQETLSEEDEVYLSKPYNRSVRKLICILAKEQYGIETDDTVEDELHTIRCYMWCRNEIERR